LKFKDLLPWLGVGVALLLLLIYSTLSTSNSKRTAGQSGPVRDCVTTGVQCHMGGSKLGVCAAAPRGGFTCMSQH